MRKSLLILLLITLGFNLNAQITMDLGKDTTFCNTFNGLHIGKNLVLQGDTSGISYKWICNYQSNNINYSAGDLLDNTTVPSPVIVNIPSYNKWVKFVLEITKANQVYKDSINIRISQFIITTAFTQIYLTKGDSIKLDDNGGIGGGIAPLAYLTWKPGIALTDSNSFTPYCKNSFIHTDTVINYSRLVKDSVGCMSSSSPYEIHFVSSVTGISVSEQDTKAFYFINNTLYFDNILREKTDICLFNETGNQIYSSSTEKDKINLPFHPIQNQIIICKIYYTNRKIQKTIKILIK